jgi:hypothetical protein
VKCAIVSIELAAGRQIAEQNKAMGRSPVARLLTEHVGASVNTIALIAHCLTAEIAEVPTALLVCRGQLAFAIDAPVRVREIVDLA